LPQIACEEVINKVYSLKIFIVMISTIFTQVLSFYIPVHYMYARAALPISH